MAEAPPSFFCPILYELMVDPGMSRPFDAAAGVTCSAYHVVRACVLSCVAVPPALLTMLCARCDVCDCVWVVLCGCAAAVTTVDGHSYERVAIERWFRDHGTSPKTGADLQSTALIAAHSLRNSIEEWQQANCKLIPRSALTFRDPQDQIGAGSFKRVFKVRPTLCLSP